MSVPLYAFMPFSADMNLGKAYNEHMALLPDGAWAVLLDHDMALTTKAWWHQLQEAIAAKPDAGCFTAVTNRIAAPWQQVGERNNHDMGHHYRFGEERRKIRTLLDITQTKGFGGVLTCLSKAVWEDVGGFVDGLLCVDHGMHFALQRSGRKVYLIEGLYLYHRRRAFGGELDEKAVPRAANCPCRGAEAMPSMRVRLPELVEC